MKSEGKRRAGGLRGRTLAIASALVFAGIAGGIAWATIPGGDGVIHACYVKSGGALRVIDSSVTNCKRTETAIDWNVAGPQGPQGDPGPAGPGTGYADFHSGPGGAGAIQLPESGSPAARVLTLDLPDGWASGPDGGWAEGQQGLVVIASVQFTNQGDVQSHPGCTVLSDNGGYGDGHTYIGGRATPDALPTAEMTFQATNPPDAGPPSQIWLECGLGADHPPLPPGGSLDVRVLNAELTVMPRSF